MNSATSLLEKKTAMRLLQHGVFLSNKTPPITNHQALLLLAEAVLDNCVKEFKSIVKELLSGCCLDDFQATPEEMRAWLGQESGPAEQNRQTQQADKECPPNSGDPASYSNTCKEVDEKMDTETHQRLNGYVALFELISDKVDNDAATVAILQEMAKDRRAQQMREERESQNSRPATDRQKNFMKKLGIKFPVAVTKQEASVLIDEELGKNGE